MGTFMGHVLPGSFFVFWSLFHTYQICCRYFEAKIYDTQQLRARRVARACGEGSEDDEEGCEEAVFLRNEGDSTASDNFYGTNIYYCCGVRRWPVDSCLKIAAAVIGIIGETITAVDDDWNLINYGNLQHIAMFGMFGLFAAVEALNFCNYPALPRGADYGVLILAYAAEAILFSFHLDHQQMLESTLHRLLIYTIWACALTSLLELACRHNVMAPLARTYFTLLQGFWFFVVAFILYNPLGVKKGERSSESGHDAMMDAMTGSSEQMHRAEHNRMMVAVALYVLAGGTTVVLMLIISMLSYLSVNTRRKRGNPFYYDTLLRDAMMPTDIASREGGNGGQTAATLPLVEKQATEK